MDLIKYYKKLKAAGIEEARTLLYLIGIGEDQRELEEITKELIEEGKLPVMEA